MEIDYKAIGLRLKDARTRYAMTQEQIAAKAGLSKPHISNIETGATKVSLPSLLKIANSLSISIDELLCDNMVHAKDVFMNEIAMQTADCNEIEIRFIAKIVCETKKAMRQILNSGNMSINTNTYEK